MPETAATQMPVSNVYVNGLSQQQQTPMPVGDVELTTAGNSAQLYQIQVPQGKNAGDTFQANVGGRLMEIAVPKGSEGGSLIQVQA